MNNVFSKTNLKENTRLVVFVDVSRIYFELENVSHFRNKT